MRRFDIATCIKLAEQAPHGRKRFGAKRGLSLCIQRGSVRWEYQYRDRATKKIVTRKIGPAWGDDKLTISEARDRRDKLRADVLNGVAIPPRHVQYASAAGLTFGEVVERYLTDPSAPPSKWRGTHERRAYRGCLLNSALARLDIAAINHAAVRAHLASRWAGKSSAYKVQTRIRKVLDYAIDKGWRARGDNPAKDKITSLAEAPKVRHHPAMRYADVPAFWRELSAIDTVYARALQWTILTAARQNETNGMRWGEIQGNTWTVPPERMKSKNGKARAHHVPLPREALALLGPRGDDDDYVWGRKLRGEAVTRLVKGKLVKDDDGKLVQIDVHGFRSTFTDWAQANGFSFELRELALAHVVGGTTAQAYHNREEGLEPRRPMMEAWSAFVIRKPG